jgi:hypothetical protein
VLGNSLGARIALELAGRDRALSVVAIASSGLNTLPERIYQGAAMSTFRLHMYVLHPAIGPLACFTAGRVALLTGLRSQPWLASEVEALALREGLGECEDFWRLLFWEILTDSPHRARERALSGDPGPGHRRRHRQLPDPPLSAGRAGRDLSASARCGPRAPVRRPRQHPAVSAPGNRRTPTPCAPANTG